MEDWQLRNVWRNRQPRDRMSRLSGPLEVLLKDRLARRVKQIGQLAVVWDECIPEFLREHASLMTYTRGTLTVALDSAPHRYQLQMLLANGLLDAIRERFHGGPLNGIRVVPGKYDCLDFPGSRAQA